MPPNRHIAMSTAYSSDILEQRRAIAAHVRETLSLRASLANDNGFEGVWADAIAKAIDDTGLDLFPDDCPWSVEQILTPAFYPA
jgi:hypothetical protein